MKEGVRLLFLNCTMLVPKGIGIGGLKEKSERKWI